MNCVSVSMRGERRGGGPSVNKVSNSSEVTVEEFEIGHSFFLFFLWKEPFTMKPQLTCSI